MASKGRSYILYQNPLLKASASLHEGKIIMNVRGLLSSLPIIRSSIGLIDGQIAASCGEEQLFLSTWIPPAPSKAFDRLAESRIKSLLGLRTPDQVTISITEECPNRCVHCALPDSGQRLRLPIENIKDVIGQILDLGTTLVIFDGGEPTLYPELPELVEFVDERAISTLFTSGAGFNASLAKRLKKAGLYAVNVSLDSPVPKEHDAMRGRSGAFLDAMKASVEAIASGLLVDLYVVLRRENICHLKDFHELARQTGVHELTFFEVVPTGRWAKKPNVALTEKDHSCLESFVSTVGAPRIFSVPSALKQLGCFAGRNWMHITPSGEVYPCACYPQSFGNIMQESVKRIWQRMSAFPYKGSKRCPMRK